MHRSPIKQHTVDVSARPPNWDGLFQIAHAMERISDCAAINDCSWALMSPLSLGGVPVCRIWLCPMSKAYRPRRDITTHTRKQSPSHDRMVGIAEKKIIATVRLVPSIRRQPHDVFATPHMPDTKGNSNVPVTPAIAPADLARPTSSSGSPWLLSHARNIDDEPITLKYKRTTAITGSNIGDLSSTRQLLQSPNSGSLCIHPTMKRQQFLDCGSSSTSRASGELSPCASTSADLCRRCSFSE
mmetsp:Transcript_35387/g.87944  ORF Transcript_35387/g.87944 Transcript_35387/m.87944 type:complete len:242 (-) Transcript_35387:812-1537(-)